jgi:valyl-tRNA synthetase
MEIAKAYDPRQAEQGHYERWESMGCFRPEINRDPNAPKYSIVIPPPNVTGSLHMGHALQHTIMDVLPHVMAAGHRPRRHLRAA